MQMQRKCIKGAPALTEQTTGRQIVSTCPAGMQHEPGGCISICEKNQSWIVSDVFVAITSNLGDHTKFS